MSKKFFINLKSKGINSKRIVFKSFISKLNTYEKNKYISLMDQHYFSRM